MRAWITIVTLMTALVAHATTASAQTAQLETELGVGMLNQEWLLTARVGFLWFDEATTIGCDDARTERCITPIRVALNLPVRFILHDSWSNDHEVVRTKDWDDVGDFFRLLRFAQYGERWQPLYVRTGELGGVVLGHGTIANGYLNTTMPGDFAPGVEVAVNTVHGGLHMFLNDYTNPSILGLRGNIRPFAKVGSDGERSFWHRFAIGVSAVSDFAAPTENLYWDRGPSEVESTALTVVGLDVELAPITTDVVEWLLYTDLNASLGVGLHVGSTLRLALGDDWSTSLRVEGRLLGKKYIADYFGPLYHVDRYEFAGYHRGGVPVVGPKSRIAALQTKTLLGVFAQLDVAWRELLTLSVAAADHEAASDSSLIVRVAATPPGPFSFGLYWASLHRSPGELYYPYGALVASEARFTVWGPIYLHARYDQTIEMDSAFDFVPTLEWNLGVGAAFNL